MRVLITVMPLVSQRTAPAERALALTRSLLNRGHEVRVVGVSGGAWDEGFAPAFDELGVRVVSGEAPKPHVVSQTRLMRVLPFTRKAKNPQLMVEERNIEETFNNAGVLDKDWFADEFDLIQQQIKEFRPNMVYSEYSIAGIAAAKAEKVPLCCTQSYFAIPGYSAGSIRSQHVSDVLEEHGLPRVQECSDMFDWCEQRFVPSVEELDPFDPKKVVFVGAFHKPHVYQREQPRTGRPVLLVSADDGAVSDTRVIREVTKAFASTHESYVCGLKASSIEHAKKTSDHVHLSDKDSVDDVLAAQMPRAELFLNYGQREQVLDAMASGVPQVICPGDAFERKYLAYSLREQHAAMYIGFESYVAFGLKELRNRLLGDPSYARNGRRLARKMMDAGGAVQIAKDMERMVKDGVTSKPAPDFGKKKGKGGGQGQEQEKQSRMEKKYPLWGVIHPKVPASGE